MTTHHPAKIDYTCAGCGAQAVTVPVGEWRGVSLVTVPHGPGCPVAARVLEMRNRSYLRDLAVAL